MYYLLNENFKLKGWEKLPFVIIDRGHLTPVFTNKKVMDVLEMCNGKVDFDLPFISAEKRKTAAQLESEDLVRQCAYGEELKPYQEYTYHDNRYMHTVHWSVTGRCNCKCKHCYMSAADAKYGELSHEAVMKIVQEMGECGVLECTLTGGEALVRPDFWDIVDGLIERDIRISQIYSNGLLVNEKLLDGLEKRGISPEINMSFDGAGSHDWLRGIPGAEDAVKKAFMLCRDRGFPTGAEMCLWRDNANALRQSINILAELGCRGVKVNPIADAGAWKDGGFGGSHSLSDDEVLQVYFDYITAFYEDLPDIGVHLGGFFIAHGAEPERYMLPAVHCYSEPMRSSICVHARNTMYISAEGRAETCMGMAGSADDFQGKYPLVQELGLKDCLTDSAYMKLIDTRAEEVISRNEKCRGCKYRNTCLGGCRAAGMLYHPGDVFGVDEMFCKIYRDGWLDRLITKIAKLYPSAECREVGWLRKQ